MRSLRSVVVVALSVSLLAACNQNNSANKSAQTAPQPTSQATRTFGANAMMGNRPRLRMVCANDIARFCQGNQRIRICLRQNMQNLAADCRTALQEVIEAARERRLERMDNRNFNNNTNQGNGSYNSNGNTNTGNTNTGNTNTGNTNTGNTNTGNNAGSAGAGNSDGDGQ